MFYQVKEGGYSRLTKCENYLAWCVEMMMLMIMMTCQNNWMASRARGTTESRKPEKNLYWIIFSRLSQENVPKLNFMNHVILCFPSWDSSIPESRLCIKSFLFILFDLVSPTKSFLQTLLNHVNISEFRDILFGHSRPLQISPGIPLKFPPPPEIV